MVAFDVAGTVLNDDGLVISAFKNAFEATQPELWPTHGAEWTQYAIDTMGQSKLDVFTKLLGDAEKAHTANVAFEESYVSKIAEFGAAPIAGAEDAFKYLRSKGIAIALTTGFSRSTLETLINELEWKDLIDISVTPGEAGRGRPHPDMLTHGCRSTLGISKSGTCNCSVETLQRTCKPLFLLAQVKSIGVLTGAHDEHTAP